jgi:hypothetical protein
MEVALVVGFPVPLFIQHMMEALVEPVLVEEVLLVNFLLLDKVVRLVILVKDIMEVVEKVDQEAQLEEEAVVLVVLEPMAMMAATIFYMVEMLVLLIHHQFQEHLQIMLAVVREPRLKLALEP